MHPVARAVYFDPDMSQHNSGGGHASDTDLSPSQAAGRLGGKISADTVRRACREGKLGYWFRGRWYIKESEIEAIRERRLDPWRKYA